MNAARWSRELDNAQNKLFVDDFEKEHGRLPSMYASQGYDAALQIEERLAPAGGRAARAER